MPAIASSISDPRSRRDLAVAWMNRGHALMQRDDRENLAAAIRAYDEAVALLRELPRGQNHSWVNSLAAALLNRGQLLHRLHGTARAADALASFDEAGALLRTLPLGHSPWFRRNLAGILLNRACLLLDLACFTEARAAASEALALESPAEKTELIDADLALKSRRALCDALGQLLTAPDADQDVLAAEAGDLVDDALALVRFWAQRGAAPFRPLSVRLFRFGARLYRMHQPHFLADFLLEHLGATSSPDPELQPIALENIDAALAAHPGRPWLTIGEAASERQLRTWRELKAVRTRFASAA